MERNKKNTLVDALEVPVKENSVGDVDVEGEGAALSIYAPEKKTPAEINGPKGPEPTRYGDWEQKGRCTDF